MFKRTINRREAMRQGGFGVGSLALAGVTGSAFGLSVLPDPACNPKNEDIEVATAISFLGKVGIILPDKKTFTDKIVKVLQDFDKDYKAGDFKNALSLFKNADALLTQFLADIGTNVSDQVKIALALAGAAFDAIAILLKDQSAQPAVLAAAASMTPEQSEQIKVIERRANPQRINRIFAAIK